MQNSQTLRKQIQITNLNTRTIYPKPGQTFQAFGVHEVFANDGVKYETTDQAWFGQRQIGETLEIEYAVQSNSSPSGKIYTNYKIVTPKAGAVNVAAQAPTVTAGSDRILPALKEIYRLVRDNSSSIETLRLDMIARFEMVPGSVADPIGVNPPTNQTTLFPPVVDVNLDDANAESEVAAQEDQELVDEEDLPF